MAAGNAGEGKVAGAEVLHEGGAVSAARSPIACVPVLIIIICQTELDITEFAGVISIYAAGACSEERPEAPRHGATEEARQVDKCW